ncbi:hypothetical protein BC832DRAFT_255618 [Gaertneriomyces semiglobifer]|nr:hypothetical protein BC832DRAFT_255618 [Gaertneriomyces semiglobifer]
MSRSSTAPGPVISSNAGNIPTVTPLPFTAAGRLTSNPLLVKEFVGRTRPSVYRLPGFSHVYGISSERSGDSAGTVLHHWHLGKHTSYDVNPSLDYVAMNRATAKQGLIHSKEIREYRKAHPIHVYVGTEPEPSGIRKVSLPSDNDPQFAYGKPTRPSTPVAELITDKYKQEWIAEQEKRIHEKRLVVKVRAADVSKKATIQRPPPPPKYVPIAARDPKSLWKIHRFTEVPAHLKTRRDGSDPAMSYLDSEGPHDVFKVANDKWLGLYPRCHGADTAAAAEGDLQNERAEKIKEKKRKEVRFAVHDWKSDRDATEVAQFRDGHVEVNSMNSGGVHLPPLMPKAIPV